MAGKAGVGEEWLVTRSTGEGGCCLYDVVSKQTTKG